MASKFKTWLIGDTNKHFAPIPTPTPIQNSHKPKVEVPGFPKPVNLPSSRSSIPHNPITPSNIVSSMGSQYRVVNHQFIVQVIPLIRKLMMINPDVGQAIHNIITLGNTGHKVNFHKDTPPEDVAAMRDHLDNKKLIWSAGCAGMDGVINKMFAQLLVSGALSNEWIVNKQINGLDSVILVNPEDIVFTLEEGNIKYTPWQRIIGGFGGGVFSNSLDKTNPSGLIPLNKYTYRYYGLNGDTEVPYGFPPYMGVLQRIETQNNMQANIDFVIDQMGLLGFLEILMAKPDKMDGESTANYTARLDTLLVEVKARVEQGIKDGVIVGFEGDTTFKFNSFTREVSQAIELFKNNELMIGSGLKQDMTLLGRDYNTSETQITVVFMKMISEMRNIQNIIKANLEFGYSLELTLAGFQFPWLKVQFNKSTLLDDLKYQQAEEIKIRNVTTKQLWGYISQDQAADELGYESPAEPEALVDYDILAGGSTPMDKAVGDQKREKGKDTSDKKVRKKNKPVSKDK